MKKLLILFIFSTLLLAQNPLAYSALGDVIYDNAKGIEKLQNIKLFEVFQPKIQKYLLDVSQTKKYGFALDNSEKGSTKKEYLNKLRELSKTNDFFLRSARNSYHSAIQSNDSQLFSQLLNTGLIDIKSNIVQIKTYYEQHSDEINATEYVKNFFDEDARIKQQEQRLQKPSLTKEQIEEERIKRIRANDRAKREALKKTLDEEAIRKKIQIREEQKKELLY